MKHIIISIGVAIIVLTGIQALPVSPDLKFEKPEEQGAAVKENIRRKKHENSSPIEAFTHQHPIQLQLSTQQQRVPLRGLFTGHTFQSSQSIPIYSPIEILQIPRHAIIQSNDNYFQSINVPQPQLVKIPDFTPTVSSGTFDPSQPTQIIFQRVPVVVEIIDKSKATDSANNQKENNPLGIGSGKSPTTISSINLEQNHALNEPETINSNPTTKDQRTPKNIGVLENEPKGFISLITKVQDTVLEKIESIQEIAPTSSVLEGEEKNILIGDKSSSPQITNNDQVAAPNVANLQGAEDNPTDLLESANNNADDITHEETLEEIIDKILLEYENLPSTINQNNKHDRFQKVAEEKHPTTNLKLSPPTEDLSNTFEPSVIKNSRSPIEHFMKFGIEPPKLGSFGMKMFPQNQSEKEKKIKVIISNNSIPFGKSIDITPVGFTSNTRSTNSISKSIFNANRQQDTPLSNKSPEVLHQMMNNDMLSTDEIFALLDQEIDKNISQTNGVTVINAPINLELAPNQDKHINLDNDSLAQENKFHQDIEVSNAEVVNDTPVTSDEFIEDSFSGGKSLDSPSENVDGLKGNNEALIFIPDEGISQSRVNLDSIVKMPEMPNETGSQQSAVIQLATNEELEKKFPIINEENVIETKHSPALSPEETGSMTEETTTSSKGKLDDELANLLTEIVAEAVREFLVNKNVVAIPKQLIENKKEEDAIALIVTETEKPQFNESTSADSDLVKLLNGENPTNKSQMESNFSKEAAEISHSNENFQITETFEDQLLDAGNSSSLISLPISAFEEHNRLDRKLIADSHYVSQQLLTHIDSDSPNQTQPKEEFSTSITTEVITTSELDEKETNEPTKIEHAMKTDSKETSGNASKSPKAETDFTSETQPQINNYDEVIHSDLEISSSDDINTKELPLSISNNDAIIQVPSLQLKQMHNLNFNKKDEVIQPISLTIEQDVESKLGDLILDYLYETTTVSNPHIEIQNDNEFFATTMNVAEEVKAFSEIENLFGQIDSTKELELPNEDEPSYIFSSSQLITFDTNLISTTDATLQPDRYKDEESNFTKESDKVLFSHDELLLTLQTESPSLTTVRESFWETFNKTNMDPKNGIEKISIKDNLNYTDIATTDVTNLKDVGKNLADFDNEETSIADNSIPIQDDQNKDAVDDHSNTIAEKLSIKLNNSFVTSITVTKDESVFNSSPINADIAEDTIFDVTMNEENHTAIEEAVPNLNQSGISLNENKELKASRNVEDMDLSLFFFNRKINSKEQLEKNSNLIETAADQETQNKIDAEMDIPIVDQEATLKEFIPNENFQLETTLTINDDGGKEDKDERSDSLNLDDTKTDDTFIHNNFKVIEAPDLNPNLRLELQSPTATLESIIPTTPSNNEANQNEMLLGNDNVNDNFFQIKVDTDSSSNNSLSQDLKLLSKFKFSTIGSKIDKSKYPGSQSLKVLVPKIVPFFHEVEYETSNSTIDFKNENEREPLDKPSEPEKHFESDAILSSSFREIAENDAVIIRSTIKVIDDKKNSDVDSQIAELPNNADTKGVKTIDLPSLKNSKMEQIATFPEQQQSTLLSHTIEEVLQQDEAMLENKNLNNDFTENDELHQIETNLKNTVQEEKFFEDKELSTSSHEPINIESITAKEDILSSTKDSIKDSKDLQIDAIKKSSFDIQEEIIPDDQSTDEAKQSSILKLIDSFANTSADKEIRHPADPIPLRELLTGIDDVQNTNLRTSPNNDLSVASLNTKENNDTRERVEVTVVSSRKSVSFLDTTFRRRPNLFRRPKVNRAHQNVLSQVPNEVAVKANKNSDEKNLSSENKNEEKKNLEIIVNKKENSEAENIKTEISQGKSIIDRLLKELKLVKRDSSFKNNNNSSSTVDQMIHVFEETSNLGEAQMKGFIDNLRKITKTFFQQKTDTEQPTPKFAREIAGVGQSEFNTIDIKSQLKSENSAISNNFNNAKNLSLNLTLPLLEMWEKEFSLKDENQSIIEKDKFQRIPEVKEEHLLPLTKLFKEHSVEVNDQKPVLSTSSNKNINKAQSSETVLNNTTNILHLKQNINPTNSSDYLKESVQYKFVQRVHEPIKPSLLLSVSHVKSGRSLFPSSLQYEDEFQPIKIIEHKGKSQSQTSQ